MKVVLLTIVVALIGAGVAGTGPERAKPSLRLLDRSPVTVRGNGFVSSERVRLTAIADATRTRRIRASRTGTFTADVLQALPRCESLRVTAVGAEGSRAVLKVLPAPACMP